MHGSLSSKVEKKTQSSTMKVKFFVRGVSGLRRKKTPNAFADLQSDVNTWLEASPNGAEHIHQLSRPSLDWGQQAVAVWYAEPRTDERKAD